MIRGLASRERQLDIFTEDATKNIIGVGYNYNRSELDCKKLIRENWLKTNCSVAVYTIRRSYIVNPYNWINLVQFNGLFAWFYNKGVHCGEVCILAFTLAANRDV